MPVWYEFDTFIADEYVDEVDTNHIIDNLQHLYDKINDLSSGVPGVNLVKNYPSLENTDGAQPEWWEVSGDPTLTEEDASGEGIPQEHERVLKFVVSADGGDSDYLYQPLVHADEPLLDESISKLSAGVWVYTDDAGTITLELYDNGGTTSLGTATTTTTGEWVWLEVLNKTIGTTSTEIRIKHSANDATFYVAMPMANVGVLVNTWLPRGLIYKEVNSAALVGSDPYDTNYHDLDVSSVSSNLAVIGLFACYNVKNGATTGVLMRRNGDVNADNANIIASGYAGAAAQGLVLMDDGQIVEYKSITGDATTFEIWLKGYYEWES